MDGMSILLNSLGINVDEIKQVATQVKTVADGFASQLNRIEAQNTQILAVLNRYGATDEIHPLEKPNAGSDTQHRSNAGKLDS